MEPSTNLQMVINQTQIAAVPKAVIKQGHEALNTELTAWPGADRS